MHKVELEHATPVVVDSDVVDYTYSYLLQIMFSYQSQTGVFRLKKYESRYIIICILFIDSYQNSANFMSTLFCIFNFIELEEGVGA